MKFYGGRTLPITYRHFDLRETALIETFTASSGVFLCKGLSFFNDTSAVPGTTYIVDLIGTIHDNYDFRQKKIILVSIPSFDPEDLLNWSHRHETLQIFRLVIYVQIHLLSFHPDHTTHPSIPIGSSRTNTNPSSQIPQISSHRVSLHNRHRC